MVDLLSLKPEPLPAKAVFKAHNIPTSSVARALGVSFPYACNLLNGHVRVTPEKERKLQELVNSLQGKK